MGAGPRYESRIPTKNVDKHDDVVGDRESKAAGFLSNKNHILDMIGRVISDVRYLD